MEDLKELEIYLLAWYNKTDPTLPMREDIFDMIEKLQRTMRNMSQSIPKSDVFI